MGIAYQWDGFPSQQVNCCQKRERPQTFILIITLYGGPFLYRRETIYLSKEDVDTIVYEVVNAKAASPENQGKRAPKPPTRKPRNQTATRSHVWE